MIQLGSWLSLSIGCSNGRQFISVEVPICSCTNSLVGLLLECVLEVTPVPELLEDLSWLYAGVDSPMVASGF